MTMDITQSTVDRGNVNVLVWPVFGGLMAWFSLGPGVTVSAAGADKEVLARRVAEGWKQLMDMADREREDNPTLYQRCWPHRQKALFWVMVPAAPPYLRDGILETCLEQAYQ